MQTINQTSLRWALGLLAFFALFAGIATGAQAATGGASSYTPTASASDEELAFGTWRYGGASWYGPGLWGNNTACGQTLRPQTLGVAHKTLPCGTTVKFVYHGRSVVTQVIDRGPYIDGRAWDLTKAVSDALGFEGVGRVRYAIALDDAAAASNR
jgi:rare lipoprotein A (peptidoglycan hydrolase)